MLKKISKIFMNNCLFGISYVEIILWLIMIGIIVDIVKEIYTNF